MKPPIQKDSASIWLMVFVLAVVIFGIVLMITDEFGAAEVQNPQAPITAT